MKLYIRILVKLGFIQSFNLRLTKSMENFYVSLANNVEFAGYHLPTYRLILFPTKSFIGEKYRSYFNIRRKGIAIEEIVGIFMVLGKSKTLKVRINIAPLLLSILWFSFLLMAVPMIVMNISSPYTEIPNLCIKLLIMILIVSFPLFLLVLIMKYSVKEIKKMLMSHL